jgi:rhamnosyltransferase
MSRLPIAIIYLAYHPSGDDLCYVRDLALQANVVVVSNSGPYDFGGDVAGVAIFETNVGVGAGYNAGLELARNLDSPYVMFHDQDSRIDRAMLERAYLRLLEIEVNQSDVVLSLNPIDLATRTSRTARLTKPVAEGDLLRYQDVQFSGLLGRTSHFEGNAFSEELFVDFIDSEWCWRTAEQLKIVRDLEITIGHNLGSGTRTLLGLEYSLPSPTRYFYQTRNLVWLTGQPYVPRIWPIQTTVKFGLRAIALPILEPKFLDCWKQSWLGLRVGLKDRKKFGGMRETA